jgi:hypothetical protein
VGCGKTVNTFETTVPGPAALDAIRLIVYVPGFCAVNTGFEAVNADKLVLATGVTVHDQAVGVFED